MAAKELIRKIYALGSELGIKGKGHDDLLHELVFGITGKESIKELTDKEARSVLTELYKRRSSDPDYNKGKERDRAKARRQKKKLEDEEIGYNGMATPGQQGYCKALVFQLCEADPNPDASYFDRLKGAIEKVCGTNIIPKDDPFRCVSQEKCAALIEFLKRSVTTAERRAKRKGEANA